MPKNVEYEWDVETVDEHGDILNHDHSGKCPGIPTGSGERLVLVCDWFQDGDYNRAWAYVNDGKLPEDFQDAYQRNVRTVPKRFHYELART